MYRSIWNLLLIVPVFVFAQFAGNDDFNDNSLGARWDSLAATGSGSLAVVNQRLEYASEASGFTSQYLKWADASYDEDFELIVRASDLLNASEAEGLSAVGTEIYQSGSATTRLNLRLATYYVAGFGGSRDVLANFFLGIGDSVSSLSPPVQPLTVFPESAMLRLSFDSSAKVFTAYYDDNPTDGTQWTALATFGVATNQAGQQNYNFGMSSGSAFGVYLYALTNEIAANRGEMVLDDFQAVISPLADPTVNVAQSVAVNFETELGRSYRVKKSTDLDSHPAFAAVDVTASDGLYRIVPQGEGDPQLTGTGFTLSLIDETDGNKTAFYQIEAQ